MPDPVTGHQPEDPPPSSASGGVAPSGPVTERLDETECLRLIAPGGVGRIGYTGRFGPTVLPVNYMLHEGAIVFRTGQASPLDEDLRTGIEHAYYRVAFEVDALDMTAREGWSVLIQGDVQHLESPQKRDEARTAGVEPWPGEGKDLFLRITPTRITGRRIRRPGQPARRSD
jgi:nitroimidazol reductase NimA-like FMN-containing flavoprotein (pyridoxamine 5'-phosphate oxidase superfamily)